MQMIDACRLERGEDICTRVTGGGMQTGEIWIL